MTCLICLQPTIDSSQYHSRCLRRLFGVASVPHLDIELAKLHTVALAMVGRTTLSGVQRKISLGLSADRQTLQVAVGPSRYILKPQSQAYPQLPENEWLTMRLAERAGIEVPPCGLVHLNDGSPAYIIRRFDRLENGRKLRQEDFCQLAEQPPKDRYQGSAELCARVISTFASEPLIETAKLFRLMVFCWWTGNGDMHLKNFSLLTGEDGIHRLSPAYDLLNTTLVIPDDQLALPVAGKRARLARGDWSAYADYCRLPRRAADRVLVTLTSMLDDALELVARSSLTDAFKADYAAGLRERARLLGAG